MALPSVSVVVVNLNGCSHLAPCFSSLLKQEYPPDRLELILVDNGSRDGSLELMAEQFPTVRVIATGENIGFAPAVNRGAAAATGRYLALINNDAYADPRWIPTMVAALEANREQGVVCVGARLLDWYGQRIDFVAGGVNLAGMGNQFFHGLPVDAVRVEQGEILFACGGAMLVDRAVFLDVGGFDDDFFMYFEDVDFGWRLWVRGYRVLLVPDAVVHHRQHATSSRVRNYQLQTLFERNALLTIIKNYGEENLYRMLSFSLLLMMGRSLGEAGGAIDRRDWNVGLRKDGETADDEIRVPRMALSQLMALKDILEDFPHIWRKRQAIQERRGRDDREILPLFRYPLGASYHRMPYLLFQQYLVDALGLHDIQPDLRMHRVLIISVDPLYERLAGPGIRVVEMARYLAGTCHVVLAAPERADVSIPGVECVAIPPDEPGALERLLTEVEVVVIQGFALRRYPYLKQLNRIVVVDLYDPFHLENLQLHSRHDDEAAYGGADFDRGVVNELLQTGDFFVCASERQRDFWLGALGSTGRLSPTWYRDDPAFRTLIDVVPFGVDPTPPRHHERVLKGVVPGIGVDDTVLIWGGGIWDWLDPLTVIRAMAEVRAARPDVKLFFLGHQHPNRADVPVMPMYDRAVALAKELGLYGETVFFNDHWVPYEERGSYLLEADLGISAHQEHVETRFAFRTRLLDYIWAGLPMVVAAGDTLADVVAARGLGAVVPVGDVAGFTRAILDLVLEEDRRARMAEAFEAAREELIWPKALAPLLIFCRRPRYAPDRYRSRAEIAAAAPSPAVLPAQQKRLDELEAAITVKNEHIARLETLIKQLESGRVMRLLKRLGR